MKRKRNNQRLPQSDITIFSLNEGGSKVTMMEIASLHFWPGMKLADITYGMGSFWRWIDTSYFDFYPTDCQVQPRSDHKIKIADFTKLPYRASSFDGVVFDPPWAAHPLYAHPHEFGRRFCDRFGALQLDRDKVKFKEVMKLYEDGIREAYRVLRQHGILVVKCQNGVDGRYLFEYEEKVWQFAKKIGFKTLDKFISTRSVALAKIRGIQAHSRRNYSVFYVFKK